MRIPLTLCLKTDKNIISPLCSRISKLNSPYLVSPDHACRAAFLAKEAADSNSAFNFYLSSLPTDLSNIPLFYSPENMSLISGSIFERSVTIRKGQFGLEYKAIKDLPEMISVSLDQYLRFRTIENMRNITVKIGESSLEYLVPIGDLIQHSQTPNSVFNVSPDVNSIIFKTIDAVQKGSTLTVDFGIRSQFKNLLSYGFTTKTSRDRVHFFELTFKENEITNKEISLTLHWKFTFNDVIYQLRKIFSKPSDRPNNLEVESNSALIIDNLLAEQQRQYRYSTNELNALLTKETDPNRINIFRVLLEEQKVDF